MLRLLPALLLVTLCLPEVAVPSPVFPRDYAAGYDPAADQRHGIRGLPDEAWGPVVNGLQAALNIPDSIKYNEKVPLYIVIRNVSGEKIRFTLCEPTGSVSVLLADGHRRGTPVGRGGHVQPPKRHELQPGHQTLIFCAELMIQEKDLYVPIFGGIGGIPSGACRLSARCNNQDRNVWIAGVRYPLERGEDEWIGWLETAKRPVEVLAESVRFEAVVPPEFPEDHGVPFTTKQPQGLQTGPEVRRGLSLYSAKERTEFWLQDHGNYERSIFWGPISAEQLVELGIFEILEENVHTAIALGRDKAPHNTLDLVGLLTRPGPFAALGFELLMQHNKPEQFARLIRDRRPHYIEMGLEQEMRLALEQASRHLPPLPDRSEFQVVTKRDLPPGLRDETWGPADDGLRAAALMPEVVTADRPKKVRLFIQNVSDAEIYLNQGNRPGFDYPMARDAEGNKLRINRDAVYGFLISSSRRPEAYPGQSKGGAPFTSFTGLLLKPGAIWELKTHTALAVYTGHNANEDLREGAKRIPREPGTNFVETQPIEAVVTWHLHSANGAEYTADWKRPLWPAKGGWSGVLRTAPVTVALRAAK